MGQIWYISQVVGSVMAIYLNVSNTYLNHSSTPKPRREFRRSSPFKLCTVGSFHFRTLLQVESFDVQMAHTESPQLKHVGDAQSGEWSVIFGIGSRREEQPFFNDRGH